MPPENTVKLMMCVVCNDALDDNRVAYRCKKCATGVYCKQCLVDWFRRAIITDTMMPVACCEGDILQTGVDGLLTLDEIKKYAAKREEWITPKRRYCPVSSCSAFVPPRHYTKEHAQRPGNFTIVHGIYLFLEPCRLEDDEILPTAKCPKCSFEFCTGCRDLPHLSQLQVDSGVKCDQQDVSIDQALMKRFKEWGVKQCPSCGQSIRLIEGCPHVRCLCCAFQFCWKCLDDIDYCECNEEDEDDDGLSEDDEEEIDERGLATDTDDDDDEAMTVDATKEHGGTITTVSSAEPTAQDTMEVDESIIANEPSDTMEVDTPNPNQRDHQDDSLGDEYDDEYEDSPDLDADLDPDLVERIPTTDYILNIRPGFIDRRCDHSHWGIRQMSESVVKTCTWCPRPLQGQETWYCKGCNMVACASCAACRGLEALVAEADKQF